MLLILLPSNMNFKVFVIDLTPKCNDALREQNIKHESNKKVKWWKWNAIVGLLVLVFLNIARVISITADQIHMAYISSFPPVYLSLDVFSLCSWGSTKKTNPGSPGLGFWSSYGWASPKVCEHSRRLPP